VEDFLPLLSKEERTVKLKVGGAASPAHLNLVITLTVRTKSVGCRVPRGVLGLFRLLTLSYKTY